MKEVRKNRMGTEPILKLITKMSIPAMFSMLVQALYNIVDSIFVAQISDEALTAISLAFPVQVLLIAVAVGTGVGVNSLISRRLGERRQDDADNAAKHGIILGFISWVPFLIFGLLFTRIFFESFTSNQDIINLGVKYTSCVSIFSFGVLVQCIIERILQATAPSTKLNFSKIGGQDKAIEELKRGILYPIKYPEGYNEQDITRGYILHGPAGTGKTALCKALANEAGVHSEYASGTAFQAKYVGESEANVRDFFNRLVENQPSIGIIDEIDAIGVERGAGDHYGDKLIDQILTCMTDIYDNGDNVYILGLTNRYDALDTALKRAERFSKHIRIGEPDKDGVRQILKIHTDGRPLDKNINTDEIVNKMYEAKAVGGDIKFMSKLAKESMMKRLGIYEKMENGTFTEADMKNATITQEDFLNAIEEFKTQHRDGRKPIGFGKK